MRAVSVLLVSSALTVGLLAIVSILAVQPPVLAQEVPQISGTVNLDTVGGGGGGVRVEERHSFDNISLCGLFPVDAEGRFSGEFLCPRSRPDPLVFTYIDAGGAEIPLTAGRVVLATDPLEGLALTRGPAVERPESGHGVGNAPSISGSVVIEGTSPGEGHALRVAVLTPGGARLDCGRFPVAADGLYRIDLPERCGVSGTATFFLVRPDGSEAELVPTLEVQPGVAVNDFGLRPPDQPLPDVGFSEDAPGPARTGLGSSPAKTGPSTGAMIVLAALFFSGVITAVAYRLTRPPPTHKR